MKTSELYNLLLNYTKLHKKIFITLLLLLIPMWVGGLSLVLLKNVSIQGRLSSYSSVLEDEDRTKFSLNSEDSYLYKTKNKGLEGVKEFLAENPKYKNSLLPNNFLKNSELTRSEKDTNNPFLKKNKISSSKEHYFFTQKINGIPVYGSSLIVHIKNGNEIYSISGNLIKKDIILSQKISKEEAENKTLVLAKEEAKTKLIIFKSENLIFNKKIAGLSNDPKNYYSLAVTVKSDTVPTIFSKIYYIDLNSGSLLYSESEIHEALNRSIFTCSGGSSCSNVIRTEGSSLSGNHDGDTAYDELGNIYNFYNNNYGRDSYNGAGATLKGTVQYPGGAGFTCPNAAWTGSEMVFCSGLVTPDITWHEMTHAVTQYSARLQYSNQSGALNESVSDIFGSDGDNNWLIGDGSAIGVIRDMSNPPAKGHPDSIFAQQYYCGGGDSGGVHSNSGVMNKAFFLMTDGGDFNGCNVSGLGREKSSAIIYYALTRYLSAASNFKDMYVAVAQSCNDVDPATCPEAKKALQAVQMDQQPGGSQQSPKCSGQPKTPATCSDPNIPTETPFPTGGSIPTRTPTPTPTPVSTGTGDWHVIVRGMCEAGNVSSIKYDYEITGGKLNIQTIGTGVEDKSSGLDGTGSYTAKGNQLTPPNSGLKTNYAYTFEIHNDVTGENLDSKQIKTPICSVQNPTSTPTPTSSVPTTIPTVTPTPQQTYTCGSCSGIKNAPGTIQIGQLCCTPN